MVFYQGSFEGVRVAQMKGIEESLYFYYLRHDQQLDLAEVVDC
jgi:hypothetical protein